MWVTIPIDCNVGYYSHHNVGYYSHRKIFRISVYLGDVQTHLFVFSIPNNPREFWQVVSLTTFTQSEYCPGSSWCRRAQFVAPVPRIQVTSLLKRTDHQTVTRGQESECWLGQSGCVVSVCESVCATPVYARAVTSQAEFENFKGGKMEHEKRIWL